MASEQRQAARSLIDDQPVGKAVKKKSLNVTLQRLATDTYITQSVNESISCSASSHVIVRRAADAASSYT